MHATIEQPVSKLRIDTHTTVSVLLETTLCIHSEQNGYIESVEKWQWEAGSNTSTVVL
jgi:hypothetical protein